MNNFICCICGCKCIGWGNVPDGAMWLDPDTLEPVKGKFNVEDRCCDECNTKYVIPGRIYTLKAEPELTEKYLKNGFIK